MKTVAIFKQVGGHQTFVKVRGRWYWVCSHIGGDELRMFNEAATKASVSLARQAAWPTPLTRAYREHGSTFAAIMKVLPQWTENVGF